MAGLLRLMPIVGLPQVREGDDLAALLVRGAEQSEAALEEGDVVVVSSKVVSKALGLWAAGERESVIGSQTVRVVAERRTDADRTTRIVAGSAGPVMAAGGVDASNLGGHDGLLLLPSDPDAEAERLRAGLLVATGLRRLGVVLSDTAGRPWRAGQTDFALGAAGVVVLDDLRGAEDADGRPLAVTARALADELAAAADLVKGKRDGIPAAVVRGSGLATADRGPGAAALLRLGPEDWFDYGRAEAVRASLGVEPGSPEARDAGIPSALPEPVAARVSRALAVALRGVPEVGAEAGTDAVRLSAGSPFALGRAAARLQSALWGEGLHSALVPPPPEGGAAVVELLADVDGLADVEGYRRRSRGLARGGYLTW